MQEDNDTNLCGGCVEIWRKEPLDETFRKLLLDYANDLGKFCLEFSIKFEEPRIDTEFEEAQIIRAIGYRPKECIVVCGLFHQSFYAIEEILRKFGGYLKAGAPEEVINTINGKALRIWYLDEVEIDDFDNPVVEKRGYRLLDADFVERYFNVQRDPAVLRMFSLDDYMIEGVPLKTLLKQNTKYFNSQQ